MRDLVVRTAALGVTARGAAAARVLRRGAVVLAGLVALAGAPCGHVPAAAAAEAAPPAAPAPATLRIVEYGGGRAVFDALTDDIIATAGPDVHADADHTNYAGFQAFCQKPYGPGPDILLTTRRILTDVASQCAGNDAQSMAEIELGRGALVLAVRRGAELTHLTSQQVYLALARDVPYRGEFRRNTAIRWSDIDRSLPAEDIRFQLPSREAGGRSLFDALVLEVGCRQEPLVMQIFLPQPRTARCLTTRVDRVRDIPREQVVRELLEAPEGTVGVLSYVDVVQTGGALVPLALDGVVPTDQTILEDSYPVSGSYWMYVRRGQPGATPAVNEAVTRIIARAASEAMIGPDGALTRLGMLPLPADEREAQRTALTGLPDAYYGFGTALGWVVSAADSAWTLTGLSYGDINPPSSAESIDLTTLMGIAGFKIKQIDTSVGIIPSAGMTFGIVRLMSQGDQYYLERTLYHDSRQRRGLLSAIQRRIIHTIVDVSATKDYRVSKVDINLFPLPSVTLSMTPAVAPPLTAEATTILQAIERVQERLTENGR